MKRNTHFLWNPRNIMVFLRDFTDDFWRIHPFFAMPFLAMIGFSCNEFGTPRLLLIVGKRFSEIPACKWHNPFRNKSWFLLTLPLTNFLTSIQNYRRRDALVPGPPSTHEPGYVIASYIWLYWTMGSKCTNLKWNSGSKNMIKILAVILYEI